VIPLPDGYTVTSVPAAAQPTDLTAQFNHREATISQALGVPRQFWSPEASTAAKASESAAGVYEKTCGAARRKLATVFAEALHNTTLMAELDGEQRPVVVFVDDPGPEMLRELTEQAALTAEVWLEMTSRRTGIPVCDLRAPATLARRDEATPPGQAEPEKRNGKREAEETDEAEKDKGDEPPKKRAKRGV
jgi:hypothetical protein